MCAAPLAREAPARLILAFVAATAVEKAIAIFLTGFNDDEAYTLVIARQLALSYFDHPPLHQWILHGFVALAGEGRWDRLPFWAMHVATNVPLYGLTRRLLGRDAALWALFAFNASPYFLTLPDGFIMPDAPLLLCLAAAVWAVAEIVFAPPERATPATALWLAAGLALGLACLSKYSALFAPLSLLGFFAFDAGARRWLREPAPYLAAAAAMAIFSPALAWNAERHWVSFAFQSGRAAAELRFDLHALGEFFAALGAQVALLSPWIGVPVVAALSRAARPGAGRAERLLLWLAAPPLIMFAATPLFGKSAIPHWFNSGWLFAFPLAGGWLAERRARTLSLWSQASAGLAVAVVALYLAFIVVGLTRLSPFAAPGMRDPTASYDWSALATAQTWSGGGGKPPDFVVVDSWRAGGRVGVALGPGTPICVFNSDPRGFAFQCDMTARLSGDALIVAPEERADADFAAYAPYFASLSPREAIAVGRLGRRERTLILARGMKLLRPYPLPYGPDR